jgi:hypothetical protein
MFILLFLFLAISNFTILKKRKKYKNEAVLFHIYPANYRGVFILIAYMFFIILFILHELQPDRFRLLSGIIFLSPFIFSRAILLISLLVTLSEIVILIALLVSTIQLFFVKSKIVDNAVVLNTSIFEISEINEVKIFEKNVLKIYFKKKLFHAIFGEKTFKVNETDSDAIYNFLCNRISSRTA